jgi:hypothetical protein
MKFINGTPAPKKFHKKGGAGAPFMKIHIKIS